MNPSCLIYIRFRGKQYDYKYLFLIEKRAALPWDTKIVFLAVLKNVEIENDSPFLHSNVNYLEMDRNYFFFSFDRNDCKGFRYYFKLFVLVF